MNWDQVEGKWTELKGTLREKWGKLTDNDVESVAGKFERLSGRLQERYGYEKEQADREINDWIDGI